MIRSSWVGQQQSAHDDKIPRMTLTIMIKLDGNWVTAGRWPAWSADPCMSTGCAAFIKRPCATLMSAAKSAKMADVAARTT